MLDKVGDIVYDELVCVVHFVELTDQAMVLRNRNYYFRRIWKTKGRRNLVDNLRKVNVQISNRAVGGFLRDQPQA